MLAGVFGRDWDVVIIGAGLGGGSAGRRLAELGLSVLFLEKGPALESDPVDASASRGMEKLDFWAPPIFARIDDKEHRFADAIGSCVGGSSLLYAATLERPERSDLDDSDSRPHPTGGWPVGYDRFAPYFSEVERRFFVRGTADPLSAEAASLLVPSPLRGVDTRMSDAFTRFGMHPYRVHQALRDKEGCLGCFGRICRSGCKMDGRSAGVLPALALGNSAVVDHCTVVAIRGEAGQVTHLDVERLGERARVRGKRYILAGGGFGSPQLLLASKSEQWPNGCGNSSGLVGRNLMFHLLESIAIWPDRRAPASGPSKALTIRDLYYREGKRYGVLQSSGLDAGYGEVLHALRQQYAGSLFGPTGALRRMANLPVWVAIALMGKGKVYRVIIEDLPYQTNRVVFDESEPTRVRFEYTVFDELRDRRLEFRAMLRKQLKLPMLFLTRDIELDLSHACGTLRFGHDPRSSVLDPNCRFHDIGNLYAADASFMPTSCGVNPGLLVAANALRVADAVALSLGRVVREYA